MQGGSLLWRPASIAVDTVAPVLSSLVVNSGNNQSTGGNVDVEVAGSDASGLQLKLWVDSEANASFANFVTQTTVNIPTTDGPHTVGAQLRDAAGNLSAKQSFVLNVDGTPPTLANIQINSGAAITNSTTVSLALSASDADEYRISESPTFTSAPWGATSATLSFDLSSGDGNKVVYAQFRDAAGNLGEVVSDSIVLDRTAPNVQVPEIDSGAVYNTDPAGQLNLQVSGLDLNGISHMRILSTNTGDCSAIGSVAPQGYVASLVHAYAGAGANIEETVTVCIALRDSAENWSGAVSAQISYDTLAPVVGGTPLQLAAGLAVTSDLSVAAAISASGASEMQLSTDSGFAGAAWVDYGSSGSAILTSGDGTKTVYVRFRDEAGNTTVGSSDSIELDQTGPTGTSFGGPTAVSSTSVVMNLTATDPHGPLQMRVSEDPAFGSADWQAFAATAAVSLSAADGLKTVYAQFRDSVSNTSAVLQHLVSVDTTGPGSAAVSVQDGQYVSDSAVTVLLASDGASEVRLSQSSTFGGASWEALSVTKSFTLTGGDGAKNIYAQYRDQAGNTSAVASVAVTLDTTVPVIGSFVVNGGNTSSQGGAVTVAVSASDANALQMKLWSGDEAAASYGPYVTSTSVLVSSADGAHTVGIKIRDVAGNESAPSYVVLNVDGTPPTLASVSINAGAQITSASNVTLTLSASGANEVRVSESATTGRCELASYIWHIGFSY